MTARKSGGIGHRYKLLFGALGATAVLLVGVAVGFVILLSGGFSTAATTQHFAVTHRLLDLGLRVSVNAASRNIDAPPLADRAMLQNGMACYRLHCVQCHGSPGQAQSPEARGMLPIPTSLAQASRDWSPAALYYITKKGIRMTGMPAWEFRLSEQSLWSTVAFLAALPLLTESQYQQMHNESEATACPPNTQSPAFTSHKRGDMLLRQYACHSCHRIQGITGPQTYVGPALMNWPQRKFIAGVVPNTRDNLIKWIQDPQAVSHQTLMPNLDVPEAHAGEMATYLMAPP
ncbi:MAG: cytochrome c [Candidatus Obscuribacterales bacterium]|nr:cytochrome c [Steroidobacteraceae bacterium]